MPKRVNTLAAWKRFKKKYPNDTVATAVVVLDILTSTQCLSGAYGSMMADRRCQDLPPNATKEQEDYAVQKGFADVERMFWPRAAVDSLIREMWGIDRTRYEKFDPVELSDSFGYDAKVRQLLGLKP